MECGAAPALAVGVSPEQGVPQAAALSRGHPEERPPAKQADSPEQDPQQAFNLERVLRLA